MAMGRTYSVRALVAAAGLLASVPMSAERAQARPDSDATPTSTALAPAETLDRAADLIANGKAVKARAMLLPLTSEGVSTGLSNAEREKVFRLLNLAGQKIKAMSPIEVSLQTAEGSLASDDLRVAEVQAQGVIDAPKATNEQVS